MKVICEIYLILESRLLVKVFSQDITDNIDNHITQTNPVYSAGEFETVCRRVADELCIKWEDRHDLSGRTIAKVKIRME